MAEQTTIRADQIEGLADLIREQVRAVIYESKPVLQDVEELRRSPAGTVIRLEGKVEPWMRRSTTCGRRWTSGSTL